MSSNVDWNLFGFQPEDGRTAPTLDEKNLSPQEQEELLKVRRICMEYRKIHEFQDEILRHTVEFGPSSIKGKESYEGEFQKYYRERQMVALMVLEERHGSAKLQQELDADPVE